MYICDYEYMQYTYILTCIKLSQNHLSVTIRSCLGLAV